MGFENTRKKQNALCIHRFHTLGSANLRLKAFGEANAGESPKAKLDFALTWQLFT